MKIRTVAALAAFAAASSAALAGPDWLERGDAGEVLSTSQRTLGVGQLSTIGGNLNSGFSQPDLADMFLVSVTDPGSYSFEINNSAFPTSLWLFNITQANEALGLLANVERSPESNFSRLTGAATDGSGASINQPGLYAVVIAIRGYVPVSNNGEIFLIDLPTEISGPDGPGGFLPHTGWAGEPAVGGGGYTIGVKAVGYADIPAPGAVALAGMAGVLAARRRRR